MCLSVYYRVARNFQDLIFERAADLALAERGVEGGGEVVGVVLVVGLLPCRRANASRLVRNVECGGGWQGKLCATRRGEAFADLLWEYTALRRCRR
jgi:hypothetical protein